MGTENSGSVICYIRLTVLPTIDCPDSCAQLPYDTALTQVKITEKTVKPVPPVGPARFRGTFFHQNIICGSGRISLRLLAPDYEFFLPVPKPNKLTTSQKNKKNKINFKILYHSKIVPSLIRPTTGHRELAQMKGGPACGGHNLIRGHSDYFDCSILSSL